MSFIWNTFVKDLQRRRRNPVEFLIWIGIPLIIGVLIITAFGGKSGPRPQIPVLVADADGSFLSGMLVASLSQGATGGLIRVTEVTETDGREQMDDAKASALLIIPDGFGQAALRENPTTLTLLTNPSQQIMPGIVEETLSVMVDGSFYLQRLFGDDLRVMADGPPDGRNTFVDSFVSGFSLRMNHLAERLVGYFDPVVVKLQTETLAEEEDAEPALNFAVLFMAGIIFMSLMFMAMGVSGDFWEERLQRTLRRVLVSPRSVVLFMAGKMLAGVWMILVVCVIALGAGYLYFRMSPATFPLAVTWATCSGAMLLAGLTLLQVHAPSQRAGSIVTTTVIFPLIMLGGSFFPMEFMPEWMAAIGRFTPNGWALQEFKAILQSNIQFVRLLIGFTILGLITVVLFGLAAIRVKTRFAQGD